jgi:site-specific DNA-cytosine methylase
MIRRPGRNKLKNPEIRTTGAGYMATTVDVYCGCGGLTLGARQAGFRSALAIDIDPILTSSFRRNFPDAVLMLADAAKINVGEIAERVGPDIDGVIGGPPCQAFSEIGRGDPDDRVEAWCSTSFAWLRA